VLVLGVDDCFVQFSKNGVKVENSGSCFDEEFQGQYYDIFIVLFAFVINEGS